MPMRVQISARFSMGGGNRAAISPPESARAEVWGDRARPRAQFGAPPRRNTKLFQFPSQIIFPHKSQPRGRGLAAPGGRARSPSLRQSQRDCLHHHCPESSNYIIQTRRARRGAPTHLDSKPNNIMQNQNQTPNPQPNQPIPTPTTPKSIRRIRGDAFWSRLKSDHRKQIQHWLMEDRLPFRDVHQRVRETLHLDCALSTIGRCYKHILREQAVTELCDAHDAAKDILNSGANMAQMRAASMQLITKRLLEQALDNGETSTLRDLGRLVLEAEEKEIRRERTRLLREKFQFKATEAARIWAMFAPELRISLAASWASQSSVTACSRKICL